MEIVRESSFLISLEARTPQITIKMMRGENGIPTVIGSEISSILHSFYTKLYAPSSTDVKERDAFWENIVLPQMFSAQADSLIKPIISRGSQKCYKAIENSTVLGPDGLTNEFYNKILGPKLEKTLMAWSLTLF